MNIYISFSISFSASRSDSLPLSASVYVSAPIKSPSGAPSRLLACPLSFALYFYICLSRSRYLSLTNAHILTLWHSLSLSNFLLCLSPCLALYLPLSHTLSHTHSPTHALSHPHTLCQVRGTGAERGDSPDGGRQNHGWRRLRVYPKPSSLHHNLLNPEPLDFDP